MPSRLIEFYGTECPHCMEMEPLIERLEKELKVKVTKFEVWHNSQNAKLMEQFDKDEKGRKFCGGVPFFYNEKTGKKICGSTGFEELKDWAMGK